MKITIIFLLILSLSAVPLLAEESPLPDGSFKKGSAEYYDSGHIKKCKLKDTINIQNIPCKNWIWFHENGKLAQFQLSEKTEIQGIMVPPGSTVFKREDGSLEHCWFSKDVMVQGYPCNGGSMKVDTAFHANGKISCCFLSEATEIQGIPCQAGVMKPVQFSESGNLMNCSLSQNYIVGEKTFKKGQKLAFDENGNVVSAE
ncbi:MAG: hypothetical protein V1766_13555 [Pseudomonadota bacterium]